jgi:hypothetical protein
MPPILIFRDKIIRSIPFSFPHESARRRRSCTTGLIVPKGGSRASVASGSILTSGSFIDTDRPIVPTNRYDRTTISMHAPSRPAARSRGE